MSDDKPVEKPAAAGAGEQKVLDSNQQAPESKEDAEQQQAVEEYGSAAGQEDAGGKLSMHVKIHAPFNTYYDGRAFSISGENATGPFDILPKHHSFITLLSPCDLVVRTLKKGDQKITISGGLMHVKADEVIVFLDV